MKSLRKILAVLTPRQRTDAFVLLILMVIGMLLETLGVGMVIPLISLLTKAEPGQQALIVGAVLGLTLVYLVKNIFLAFLSWRQNRFAFSIDTELSQRLFTIYLRQPYTFHLQRNSAELYNTITGEVAVLAAAINHLMLLVTEGMVLAGIAVLLFVVQPLGAAVVALILGSAAWIMYRATRRQMTRWGNMRHHHAEQSVQHLLQGLGGAKDVKLLGRETEFIAQFKIHNVQSARIGQYLGVLQQLPRLGLELLMVVCLATLVLSMVAQGGDVASIVPTLGLFAAAAFRLMPSVNRMLVAMQMFRFEIPVLDTIGAELALAAPSPLARTEPPAAKFARSLEVRDLTYQYPSGATPALHDVSITLSNGECIGLIGPSGAGKSTLVDVILGLLTAEQGGIFVDGRNINEDLRSWQDQIGYVPQTIYLTDDTIRRNVAFGLGDEQIDDAAVAHALVAAQLSDFVATLPDGVQTFVGERGVRLSGGQRQRIGIARALYHNPSVLVLDEATSSLDTEAEADVMEAVNGLRHDKTILIVAHRMSTVQNCHRLYRLEQGRIVGIGAPSELLPLAHLAVT